jgi:hypothetical protein
MASEGGNINVLADAQFGVIKTLRPYVDFETDYQGTISTRPIQVTEVIEGTGGEPRDAQAIAGTPGYDPNLVRGLKVPMGARVMIYLPKFTPDNAVSGSNTELRYEWLIEWRFRNVFDFRTQRTPFHHPKQSAGFPDTSSGTSEPRIVIPASAQTSVYVGPEPTTAGGVVVQNARQEFISSGGPSVTGGFNLPFLPGGVLLGSIQQGLSNPGALGIGEWARPSFYQTIETQAAADELVLSLRRQDTPEGTVTNWDFSQNPGRIDRLVSVFLGLGDTVNGDGPFRDIGVMVSWGTAP